MWRSGPAFLPPDLDQHILSIEHLIPWPVNKVLSRTSCPRSRKVEAGKEIIIVQQDKGQKCSGRTTEEWLKRKNTSTLDWPSQSPDIKPEDMPWQDLMGRHMPDIPPGSLNWLSSARRSGQSSPKADVRHWFVVTEGTSDWSSGYKRKYHRQFCWITD